MSADLRITLVQTPLFWEDADANLNHLESLLQGIHETDLIILPEMFTTGFSMHPEKLAAESFDKGLQWMRKTAMRRNLIVCGSMMCRENERYFNRLVWMKPDGEYLSYNKKHLFTLGDEHTHYIAGDASFIATVHGVKVKPLICYDLRFPVWSRNTIQTGEPDYDLLIYVANWPERRIQHWEKLLQARAIENVCYVAGVNRIGADGNGMAHNGRSLFCDFKGEAVLLTDNETVVRTFVLDIQALHEYRKAFPALNDGDAFTFL